MNGYHSPIKTTTMPAVQSNHSIASLVLAAIILTIAPARVEDKTIFEDHFDHNLSEGWSWIRQQPAHWCVRDGALEIRIMPGNGNSVKNALVRKVPDRDTGALVIEVTITALSEPTQQYEQAGLTWYHDGKPVFKLVKELVDGQRMIIPGRNPMEHTTVQLRLVVTDGSYTAQYRVDGKGPFQTAGTGPLPPPGNDQISLQCYHGPPDKNHWIRFDNFRIMQRAH